MADFLTKRIDSPKTNPFALVGGINYYKSTEYVSVYSGCSLSTSLLTDCVCLKGAFDPRIKGISLVLTA